MTQLHTQPDAPQPPAEYHAILSCLAAIRRRLFTVRLVERASLALACGATLALPVVAARLLRDRYPAAACLFALLPVAAAALLWRRTARWSLPSIPAFLLHTAAVFAAAVAVLILLVCLWPALAAQLSALTLALSVAAAAVVVAIATVRPIKPQAAAIFVDQQVGLRERVSTALELLDAPPPASPIEAAFRAPLVASAVQACSQVRQARLGYSRLDRRVYPLAATAAIAAAGLAFLSPLPAIAHQGRRPYVQVVETSNKLATELKRIEESQPHANNPELDKKLEPLKQALTEIRKGDMSPFESAARLNEVKAEIQKEKDGMDEASRVEQALDHIKEMQQVASAADKMKENAPSGQDSGESQARQNSAREAIKSAAEKAAAATASKSDADRKQTADDLRQAAQQAQDDPALQKSLNSAADAAEKGDAQQLAKDLADAGGRIGEQSSQQQVTGQALKEAMDAIDKANAGGRSADEQAAADQAGGNQNGNQGGDQQQSNGGGDQGDQQANAGQQGGQQGGGQQGGGQQGGGQQGNSGGQQGNNPQGGNSSGATASGQQGAGAAGKGQQTQADSSGSTDFHSPGGPGDSHVGGPIGAQRSFVKIYDQTVTQTNGQTEKLQGNINPNGPAAGTEQIMGSGDKGDPTIKTYDSVLPAMKQKAMEDLQKQDIPPQYRDVVREFYQ